MKKVLFVCLGNICRSPTAEGVFKNRVAQSQFADRISIDSAGTSDWHIGHPPDPRAIEAALERDIDISSLKARQVSRSDMSDYDYILAMDNQNLINLQQLARQAGADGENIKLFMEFARDYDEQEVPDPYYGGTQGFEHVLDMIDNASQGLLAAIAKEYEHY